MGLFKWGNRSRGRWHAALACGALVACTTGAQAAEVPSAARIVGGSETTTEDWPWQVAVTREGFFACGGSLIAPDIVLTAAHCAQDPSGVSTSSADLGAVLDLTDLSDQDDPDAFAAAVRDTFVARQFELSQLAAGFDFALLLLETPLDHQAIDLATGADVRRFDEHDRVWATGWGLIDGNPETGTSLLHEVDLRLVDCSSALGFSDSLFFCVTGADGACRGDSGGPLMIRDKVGAYLQIGVSTFSDRDCEHFSAWTNVATGPVRSAVDRGIDVLRGAAPAPDALGGETSDTASPQTTITKAPKARIKTRRKRVRVTVEFTASEPSTFTCSLDGRAPRNCSSPDRFRVRRGQHRFQVFATDAAGNADPIPDTVGWRVKRIR